MPFYGTTKKLVEKFFHRRMFVEIFHTEKGGTCVKCDLEHEPEKKTCDSCGDTIASSHIYVVCVAGMELFDEPDQQTAVSKAKTFLDRHIDQLQSRLLEMAKKPQAKIDLDEIAVLPDNNLDRLEATMRKLGIGNEALRIMLAQKN